jgi:hypothetical protein
VARHGARSPFVVGGLEDHEAVGASTSSTEADLRSGRFAVRDVVGLSGSEDGMLEF